jgi:hypothetical protein
MASKLLAGLIAAKLTVTVVAVAVPLGREAVHKTTIKEVRHLGINPDQDFFDNIEELKQKKELEATRIEATPSGPVLVKDPVAELTEEEIKNAKKEGSSWNVFTLKPEALPAPLREKYAGTWCLMKREVDLLNYALAFDEIQAGLGARAAFIKEVAERSGMSPQRIRHMAAPPTVHVNVQALRNFSDRRRADPELRAFFGKQGLDLGPVEQKTA